MMFFQYNKGKQKNKSSSTVRFFNGLKESTLLHATENELTVIIPNYNNARFIEACINSVMKQSLLPYEIIVVDDCSTDESKLALEKMRTRIPILKVIYLPHNYGVSNARNIGLNVATTKYVTFMDSDDFYYDNNKLQSEMQIIRKYQSAGKDVLAYSATAISSEDGGNVIATKISLLDRLKFMRGKTKIQLVSLIRQAKVPRDYIIKKDVLVKVGAYSYNKDFYEDLDLLIRIAVSGIEFHCTYNYGTAYRMTRGGLSKRSKAEHISEVNNICNYYYAQFSLVEKVQCFLYRCLRDVWNYIIGRQKNRA